MNDLSAEDERNERHSRCRSSSYLNDRDYTCVLESVKHVRERVLLNWLHDPAADSAALFDWLRGDGFVILPQEDPSMAILRALPPVDNAFEAATRKILVYRLAEAIEWLASESVARSQLATGTWTEVFVLATRLSGPQELSASINHLRRALDAEKCLPYPRDHDVAYAFTKLVIHHQIDDELEARWVALIHGKEDPVLRASLFDAIRGLLSKPGPIDFETLESCLGQFCSRVGNAFQADEEKRKPVEELQGMVKASYPRYQRRTRLALARLRNRYQWLPLPPSEIRLIADIEDMAVLGQLARGLADINPESASMASLMYQIVSQKASLSTNLKRYIQTNIGRIDKTQMKSGYVYNQHSYLNRKAKTEYNLTDVQMSLYVAQYKPAAAAIITDIRQVHIST